MCTFGGYSPQSPEIFVSRVTLQGQLDIHAMNKDAGMRHQICWVAD